MNDGATDYGKAAAQFWAEHVAHDALAVINVLEHPQMLVEMLRTSVLLERETILVSSALAAFDDEEYVEEGLDPRFRLQVPALREEVAMANEVGAVRVIDPEHMFYFPLRMTHLQAAFEIHGRVLWDPAALASAATATAEDFLGMERRPEDVGNSELAQASLALTLRYANHAFPGLEKWPMELILEWRSAVASSLAAFRVRVAELSADTRNIETRDDLDMFLRGAVGALDQEYLDLAKRVETNALWNRFKQDLPGVSGTAVAALTIAAFPQPTLLRVAELSAVTLGKLVEYAVSQLRQHARDRSHHLGWLYDMRRSKRVWRDGTFDLATLELPSDDPSGPEGTSRRVGHFLTTLGRIEEFMGSIRDELQGVAGAGRPNDMPVVQRPAESSFSWPLLVTYGSWMYRVEAFRHPIDRYDRQAEIERLARDAVADPPTDTGLMVVLRDPPSSESVVRFERELAEALDSRGFVEETVVVPWESAQRGTIVAQAVDKLHRAQCNVKDCSWCHDQPAA